MLWKPRREGCLGDLVVAASSPTQLLESPFCCLYHGRRSTFLFTPGGLARPALFINLRFLHFLSACTYNLRTATISFNLSLGNLFVHGRSRTCCMPTTSGLLTWASLSCYHANPQKTLHTDTGSAFGIEKTALALLCPDPVGSDCFAAFSAQLCGLVDGSALLYGRLLHTHLIEAGADIQCLTEIHLVQMYCKCGCLEDAYTLFNDIHPRHLVTAWNAMISCLVKHRRAVEAHQVFYQMLIEGFPPSKVTLARLTSTCRSQTALHECHRLHACIRYSDLCTNVIVGTALVSTYGRCGSLEKARMVFDSMPSRNAVSWTALINAYVQHGQTKLAVEVFHLMQHDNVIPDKVTIISILSACSSKDALHVGKEVHAYVKKRGFEADTVIGNALLTMYGKCGTVDSARTVFDAMPERNLVSWNAMMAVYAQNGEGWEALCIARRMQQETLPDDITFVSMLDACVGLCALWEGKQIHACILGSRLESNIILGNTLVNMYGKCGSLEEAAKLFEMMHEHDEVTWNALISGFAHRGHGAKALGLFFHMQQEGLLPNKITFVSVLSACTDHGAFAVGKQVHSASITCDFELDIVVGTAIVSMYGKLHSAGRARHVFDRMPVRNVVSWTAMISAYAQNGQVIEAFTLFDAVEEKHVSVLWNAVIAAFAQNCRGKKALTLLEQMLQEGVLPDRVTFVSGLDAAASEAVLGDGKRLHSRIIGMPFEQDSTIQNSLVSMYGKCGSLDVAWKQFRQLPKRDVFAWSSMIAAYAHVGLGGEALHVFAQMRQEGVVPDRVTFVNVLSACSRAGLVREGCSHFTSMKDDYAITPTADHYNCMIDLLGKSGQLEEAEKLILNMRVSPTTVSWFTLLSACCSNVDVRRGEWAAESIFKIDPNNATPYIMLSNIYTAAGRAIDAAKVIDEMHCNCSRQEHPHV